ncbi:DUF3617 domain-containing protein [Sphingobium sp.]|uniref:DUF3617 domain-containing protein n=1 Tax=Sphingobium sp. TaxID=1912891 RepID=UPI003B3A3F97
MRRTLITLALLAALAACNDKAGEIAATDAMSKQAVKDEVDKVQLRPGQWEGRFTVQNIDMPQMPAVAKEQMKQAMGATILKYCVTPEQAANPSGEMFSGQENKDCTYAGFEAKGGKVKGQISCKAPNGGTMNAAMSGSYAPESYSIAMDMKMEGGAPATPGTPDMRHMAIAATSQAKWIGPNCAKP